MQGKAKNTGALPSLRRIVQRAAPTAPTLSAAIAYGVGQLEAGDLAVLIPTFRRAAPEIWLLMKRKDPERLFEMFEKWYKRADELTTELQGAYQRVLDEAARRNEAAPVVVITHTTARDRLDAKAADAWADLDEDEPPRRGSSPRAQKLRVVDGKDFDDWLDAQHPGVVVDRLPHPRVYYSTYARSAMTREIIDGLHVLRLWQTGGPLAAKWPAYALE